MKRHSIMKALGFAMLTLVMLITALQAGQIEFSEYKPTWSIGQKWRVEVERMTESPSVTKELLTKWKAVKTTTTYQFLTEGIKEIDGEKCSQLRIDCVAANGKEIKPNPKLDIVEFYRIYLRQSDNTLSMVERLRVQPDKVEIIDAFRKFPAEPVDATDWVGFLPLALPTFHKGQFEQEPLVRTSKKGKVEFKSSDRCRQTEEIKKIRADGTESRTLRMTLEKENSDGPSRRTTLVWIKGMPWWTEATHDRDGHQWCSARLLKD